jgi:hypothetical protein
VHRRLIAIAAIAVLAVPALGVIIEVQDFFSTLDLVATDLGLGMNLTQEVLTDYWAKEVKSIGELAPIATTVEDAEAFNRMMGESAGFKAGDIVILTATEEPARWGVDFYSRGEGSWTNPDLNVIIQVQDFFSRLDRAGVEPVGPTPQVLSEGIPVLVTVTNVEAFKAAWLGEYEVTKGQTAVMTPFKDKTDLGRLTVRDEIPVSAFVVDEEKNVTLVK